MQPRHAPRLPRLLCACLIGLALALRLLSPAGFMPAFEHGSVAIVACPDGGGASPAPHHHDGHADKSHQPCPYAAASAAGSLAPDAPVVVAIAALAAALLLGRAFLFLERSRSRQRPFPTGPPLPRLS